MIPFASKYPLDALREAVAAINRIQQNTVMIEYLMLEGVNDSTRRRPRAGRLARMVSTRHVNLIPYNAIESAPHLRTTERSARDAFAAILRTAGHVTTIRYSLGADVAAACGQLVQRRKSRAGPWLSPTGFSQRS